MINKIQKNSHFQDVLGMKSRSAYGFLINSGNIIQTFIYYINHQRGKMFRDLETRMTFENSYILIFHKLSYVFFRLMYTFKNSNKVKATQSIIIGY